MGCSRTYRILPDEVAIHNVLYHLTTDRSSGLFRLGWEYGVTKNHLGGGELVVSLQAGVLNKGGRQSLPGTEMRV